MTRARLTDVVVAAEGPKGDVYSSVEVTVWSSCRLRFFLAESDGSGDDVPGLPSMVAASVLCENHRPWHRLRHRYGR